MTTQRTSQIGLRDHLIGAAIATSYIAWLLATSRSLGFARDEGFYFHAASDYARWFQLLFENPSHAFERSAIDPIWSSNHEHPSLMKSLFALSWMAFHEKWHLFSDASTAFRFPAIVMGGMVAWTTYLFGARAHNRRVGFMAAGLLVLMPHNFYHAHLACFDVPIMAMWTLCIYVYWRSAKEGGLLWALWAGVVYGLTLETKHNAWILPAVILPHALIVHGRSMLADIKIGRISIPTNILAMATIGPMVFYALWPWLWNDTLPRLEAYIQFHVNHDYYNIEFLGVNYFGPPSPWAYAPVLIFATVPTITLVLFGLGLTARFKAVAVMLWQIAKSRSSKIEGEYGKDYATDLLWFLAFSAAIAPFFLPKTPIFGGTKHWITAYPFLALFAGYGFDRALLALQDVIAKKGERAKLITSLSFGGIVLLPPLLITQHSHPFGLSSYVPIVGGTAGGADLGLNRQFWGFTTQSVAPYLAEKAKRGASVFIHDTAWDSWARLIDEKRIRPDLRGVGAASESDFALVQHELHMNEVDYSIWGAFGIQAPDYVLTHDGVPIVSVYRKP